MAAVVEAAGNLVFQLIMNSVRELYLPRAESFAAVVAARHELDRRDTGPPRRDPRSSAPTQPPRRSAALAAAQEERMRAEQCIAGARGCSDSLDELLAAVARWQRPG